MSWINNATQKLLDQGWTKDQTPPGMRPWTDFDGGWTYDYRSRQNVVFEAPCGLLFKRSEVSMCGHMSFLGVEWTEENDCITVLCPRCDRHERCEKNDPRLEDHPTGGANYEHLTFCALHETAREWRYECSAQKEKDDREKLKEDLWEAFRDQHNGRVCRHQCRYNRNTHEWTAVYDPIQCGTYACSYCVVLGKDLSPKRANVYYDVKKTWTIPGEGLLPDEERSAITKGYKFLQRPRSETICRAIAKVCRDEIQRKEEMAYHMALFLGTIEKVEVLNIRVERKAGRDLLQDLQDVESGIAVEHVSDLDSAAKAQKSRKRQEAKEKRRRKLEEMLLEHGYEGLDDLSRIRVDRTFTAGEIKEIERNREKKEEDMQFSLFEEEGA